MTHQLGNPQLTELKPKPRPLGTDLLRWYAENKRDLPWRQGRDPYRIWISEVMLQQTTVVAVIPYYERFLSKFPTLQSLADAPLEQVLEAWAGLGYYSRARNLHKSAQLLAQKFPTTAQELLDFPGFGPYTSRAVASLAFGESVGVLDGNVIRVLTRVFGFNFAWWNKQEREKLQNLSDQLAASGPSHFINNGLMELGATICTPTRPLCLLCPWKKQCQSLKNDLISQIPQKKPRKESEVWVWTPQLYRRQEKKSGKTSEWIALVKNDYTPFLKGQMIFPGTIQQQKKKPKSFDLRHSITHHQIYIQIENSRNSAVDLKKIPAKDIQWIQIKDLKKINPSNLLQKVLSHSQS